MSRVLQFIALFARLAFGAFAHEMRPGYLEGRQTGPETYAVLWKVPGRGDNLRLGIFAEFPADTKNVTEPRGTMITPSPNAGPWSAPAA